MDSNENVRWDEFQDGDLSGPEIEQVLRRLESEPEVAAALARDAHLDAVLRERAAGMWPAARPWAKLWRPAVAAAALVGGVFLAFGMGRWTAGGVLQIEIQGHADPAAGWSRGGLHVVQSAGASATVDVAEFGSADIDGSAALWRDPGVDGRLLVVPGEGALRLSDGEGHVDTISRVPHVVAHPGAVPRSLTEVLDRLEELEGAEGLSVLTWTDQLDLRQTADDERARMERRLLDLQDENGRLSLELEALAKERGGGASLDDLLAEAGRAAERDGYDGNQRARLLRRARQAVTRRDQPDQAVVDAIDRHLLSPGAAVPRVRLGLDLLARVGGDAARPPLLRGVADRRLLVRLAAMEGLRQIRSPADRDLFRQAFASDRPGEKAAGAAGLVALGDFETPMGWLLGRYRDREHTSERLRGTLLARILEAPASKTGIERDLVSLLKNPSASRDEKLTALRLAAASRDRDLQEALRPVVLQSDDAEVRRTEVWF